MLSIIIPSRNEKYLGQTIEDIKLHAKGEIEILVGEDTEGIGQRAIMNRLARQAKGEFIMKTDAHCSFSPGFDVEMLSKMENNMIMAPYMLVLDAERWTVRQDKKSSAYAFDTNLVFQYNKEAENKELLNETMCLQGSCFLMTTENYWNWNICDESFGSWGSQGVEIGIKAFLNGGKCVTNKLAYYGHLFRTDEQDFPYPRGVEPGRQANEKAKEMFLNKNIAPLIEKYNYPCDWTREFVDSLE